MRCFTYTLLWLLLAFTQSGLSDISAKVTFLPNTSEISLNTAPRYLTGRNTHDADWIDLDGDGNLDIVSVNAVTRFSSISIVYGMSDGSLQSPVYIAMDSGFDPHTVTAGDLNQDGRPDLVAATFYQNKILVMLNQGNRTFAPPVVSIPPDPPFPLVGEFLDLAVGDFDGDGNADVVAVQDQSGKRLRFFHYSGNGSLDVFATLNQVGPGNSLESEMAVGDINGDNRPDVIFASGGPRNISFVFGTASGGPLSFTFGFGFPDEAIGLKVTDLDNDGDKDLAIAFYDSTTPTEHSLQAYTNNGTGTFAPAPRLPVAYPFPSWDIAAGDFDNDGVADLAGLQGGGSVVIAKGIGNCTYVFDRVYATPAGTRIFSTDADHNGKTDLIVLTTLGSDFNTASVLINQGSLRFAAPPATLWGPTFVDSGDLNNDGFDDYASSWQTTFNTTSRVDVLINDHAGGLAPEVSHTSPAGLSGMKLGDFNGDGNLDAVSGHRYSGSGIAVYFGNGTGALASPVHTVLTNGTTSTLLVADFNNDGRDDLFGVDAAESVFVFLSNSNGTFTPAPESPFPMPQTYPSQLRKGDFNNDRNIDVLLTRNSDSVLWLGNGTGRFTVSSGPIPSMALPVPGDFNGDGTLDLAGIVGDTVTGYIGNGSGGFGGAFSVETGGPGFSVREIVTGDFDQDGFDDVALIMLNQRGNLITIPSGGSSSSWQAPAFFDVGGATQTLVTGDFNADSVPDLAYLGSTSRGLLLNIRNRPNPAPFDFDGDGKTDISAFKPGPGEWWYLRSSDGGNRAFKFGSSTDVIVPADYTGDGKTDNAFYRNGEWFIQRSSDFSFYSFPFGDSTDIPVPADYDGDGKADAAVYRASAGTWFIQRSSDNQVVIQGFGNSTDRPVPADFDGDGKADLAIYRPTGLSGQSEWWYLRSSDGGNRAYAFGQSTDKTVVGDYTGDGKADFAFFRPSNRTWYVLRSEDISFYSFPFGTGTDIPAPGDYDGDGKTDAAVFRPGDTNWYVQRSTAGILILQFGSPADKPIPGVYVR